MESTTWRGLFTVQAKGVVTQSGDLLRRVDVYRNLALVELRDSDITPSRTEEG